MWADIGVLYDTPVRRYFDVFCGGMGRDRARWPQKVVLEQPNSLRPLENSYHSVNDLSFRKGRRRLVIYPRENKYIMVEDQLTRIVRHANIILNDSFNRIKHNILFMYFYCQHLFLLGYFNIFFFCVTAWQNYCFFFLHLNLLPHNYYICFHFLIFIHHVFFYHIIFFIAIFVTIKFVKKLFFSTYEKIIFNFYQTNNYIEV